MKREASGEGRTIDDIQSQLPDALAACQSQEDRLISVGEVAAMLGTSKRTVPRLIAAGEFPAQVKVGRLARWFLSDVKGYLTRLKEKRAAIAVRQAQRHDHRVAQPWQQP